VLPRALTISGSGPLLELKSEVRVGLPSVDPTKPSSKLTTPKTAIWDTGATGSAITQTVVDELGIQPIAMTVVHGVHGPETSPVYLVDFVLPMSVGVRGLRVTLARLYGADVLIGMDVITRGDFAITNQGGKTKMTFRVPSLADFDFVKTVNDQGKSRKDRRAAERGQKGPRR
jgi:hypothetical protein